MLMYQNCRDGNDNEKVCNGGGSMINDIDFARDNAGKYYIYRGYKVRVVGYDCSGVGNCVIVSDYPWGVVYTLCNR